MGGGRALDRVIGQPMGNWSTQGILCQYRELHVYVIVLTLSGIRSDRLLMHRIKDCSLVELLISVGKLPDREMFCA
jgi:hypothetical protein